MTNLRVGMVTASLTHESVMATEIALMDLTSMQTAVSLLCLNIELIKLELLLIVLYLGMALYYRYKFSALHFLGCTNNQFSCDNGRCIDSFRECDGFSDCTDDSDEHNECGKSLYYCK